MLKRTHKSKITIIAIAALVVCASLAAVAETPKLHIVLKSNTAREQQMQDLVERLARRYDLKKYTLTRNIMIEQGGMAHSHPVLTMNCRFLGNDDLALSQYVHEQGHWLLMRRPDDMRHLLADLMRVAPNMPTRYPEGGFDAQGTYVHLAVNMLEWQALEELIGPERARKVIEWKKGDHYKAIYAALLENRSQYEQLLQKYDMKF